MYNLSGAAEGFQAFESDARMTRKVFMICAGALCLALAVFIFILVLSGSSEEEPRMDALKLKMTAALAKRAVADMRGKLPPEFDGAVLLHFKGRHTLDVERIIKEEILVTGALRLRDFDEFKEVVKKEKEGSALSRWVDKAKSAFSDLAGQDAYEKVFGKEMPSNELKEVGVDGLVGGTVVVAEGVLAEEKEAIRLTLWVSDSMSRKRIFEESYVEELEKSLFNIVYFRHVMGGVGWGWKLVIWFSFAILFPLVTFFVPAKLLKLESNRVNMAMLVVYTVLDLALALTLMGLTLSGFGAVVLLVAAALSGVYNYGILTEIQDFA